MNCRYRENELIYLDFLATLASLGMRVYSMSTHIEIVQQNDYCG